MRTNSLRRTVGLFFDDLNGIYHSHLTLGFTRLTESGEASATVHALRKCFQAQGKWSDELEQLAVELERFGALFI